MPRSTQYEGTVYYNGVTAPFSRLDVDTAPLYAEDRTSQIGVAHTFNITGFLTGSSRTDFQTKLTQMRQAWSAPRGNFYVVSDSRRLFSFTADAGSANPDPTSGTYAALVEDWGPMPQNLRFYRFAAGMACAYSVTISCTAKECTPSSTVCDDILSKSQSWTYAVDMNGLTTRTMTGKLLVRSWKYPADKYRPEIIPTLPKWYHRVSEQFTQNEDSRELYASVVDQEEMWTLPVPITEGQASLAVHIEPAGLVTYTMGGTFGAPATVSKATILQRINDLMVAKIPGLLVTPGQKGYAWVDAFDFTDHIYANRIDFSIRARLPLDNSNNFFDTAIAAFQTFTIPPPNSDGITAVPGPFGGYGAATSGLIGPAHNIYDACGASTSTGDLGEITSGYSTYDNDRSVTAASVVTSNYGGISDAHQVAPWLAYHEEISYEYDNGIITFQPKRLGVDPLKQQHKTPRLRLIQCGYATRASLRTGANTRPLPAAPMLPSATTLVHSYVSPCTEEVVDSEWSKWTVNWRYVMTYDKAITDSNALPAEAMYFPANPIRPFTAWSDLGLSTSTNLVSVQE